MNLLTWSIGLSLIGAVALVCLTAILVYFNPVTSSIFILFLLYVSLLVSLIVIFTLIGWFLRRLSSKRRFALSVNYAFRQLEISFRQGILLASLLIAILILQSQGVLAWWNLLIILLVVGVTEWWLTKRS